MNKSEPLQDDGLGSHIEYEWGEKHQMLVGRFLGRYHYKGGMNPSNREARLSLILCAPGYISIGGQVII